MPHIVYNPRRLRKSNERLIVPACLGGIIRTVTDSIFERSISLLGDEAFSRISGYRVAIFGVGGVGGWCAEALVRTGVRNITLVDDDIVAESNVNRQRQATPSTVGRMKVEVLRHSAGHCARCGDSVDRQALHASVRRQVRQRARFRRFRDRCDRLRRLQGPPHPEMRQSCRRRRR